MQHCLQTFFVLQGFTWNNFSGKLLPQALLKRKHDSTGGGECLHKSYWLNLLARIVYGIVLPAFLLYLAVYSHFSLVRERHIHAWQQKMHDSLDNLSNFHADDQFFHGLLQYNFAGAESAANPEAFFRGRIALFKKSFPGGFRFVVIDPKGSIIANLSDEKRFQYIFKSLHQTVLNPETIYVPGRIGLLRGYFGQFLMEKHFDLPTRHGYLGSCLRASEEPHKALLWFRNYQQYTLVCFVHRRFLNQQLGAQLLINSFNASGREIKLGYFDPKLQTVFGLGADRDLAPEIMLEAGAFANSAVEFRQSASHLLLFRQVSPELVIFSRLDQKKHLIDINHEVCRIMFAFVKLLIVAGFTFFCLSLHGRNLFLSVRHKLMLLFLFANGLPLMILVATGYEFFEQKRNSLINAMHEQSSRLIKDFDSRYPAGRELMAEKLNEFIAAGNRRFGERQWSGDAIDELAAFIDYFRPSEKYLFTASGEQLFKARQGAIQNSDRFMRDFFRGSLEFFNNRGDFFTPSRRTMLEEISDAGSIYYSVIRQINRIAQQNYGSGLRWSYLTLLGDREAHSSWGMLVVAWQPEGLQRAYLNEQLASLNARIVPRRIVVMETGTEKVFPETWSNEHALRRLMHRTQNRKLLTDENLQADGQELVATSLKGIEMADAVIIALYPRHMILAQIDRLFWHIIAAAAASIFLVMVIVMFFSRRLLVPISSLSEGVRAIARHDYRHRIDYVSEDEFGQLIAVFNETIAGMQELAVGTAVQKSLLPPGQTRVGHFSLYARSEFMSRMGGDYFDYFRVGDNGLGVFFGDVAGHGIPAALVMSMAKAVVADARSQFAGPSAMLQRANGIFLHLKEKGWRRMMTAQCLELDCETGKFRLANAGQCFPVVIGEDREGVTYVKAVGMPLGNVTRKPYAEITGQLNPGDTMILYTDGIIEATNAAGEVFDFARFDKLLLATWNSDLVAWWQEIFKGYSGWAATQDDDITMLMLRYEKD